MVLGKLNKFLFSHPFLEYPGIDVMTNKNNNTIAISLDDEDDDLLNLDLDDNDSNPKPNTDSIFKKPEALPLNDDDEDDLILSTFCDNLKPTTTDSSTKNLQNDLLEICNEADEDEFIKSQSIFISSTQVVIEPSQVILSKSNNVPQVPMASKSPEIQVLETSNKSTTTVPINKVAKKATDQSPTIKNKSNDLAMLNMLVDNKTWSYALSDLRTTFRSSKLDTSSISNYNLNYYFKKFFEFDLLMKPSDTSIRKIPILSVWIKEITRKPTSATVLLTDFSNDIKGTILSSFLKNKENWNYLMIGSVLFLKDVYLLQVNHTKNCYHLNINLNNIVNIYYPDLDQNVEQINTFHSQQFNSDKIKQLINEFEKNYTNYDYKPAAANDSTINKSIGTKKSKSNSNKSAPYHLPAHLNKNGNKAQTNQNTSSLKIISSKSNNNANKNNNVSNPKPPVLSSSKTSTNTNNFQFNKPPSETTKNSSINQNSTVNKENTNTTNLSTALTNIADDEDDDLLFMSNLVSSTQKTQNPALSQDIFSQLIFGIEDELLNDDFS